jgi:membrane fusion protein (multidrug efflux system)
VAAHTILAPPAEETDDAYVNGDVVIVTSREAGMITAVNADTTQSVKAGQALLELDSSSADAELSAAQAALGAAVRDVRSDFSKVSAARAEILNAQAQLDRSLHDLARRREAARSGAVAQEEVAHAADEVRSARAALSLASSKKAEAEAAVGGTSVDNNPDVLRAAAELRRRLIVRDHMRIAAPVSGVVAQRSVQIGQQVSPGTPLMAVVPLDKVWIDANFRETQLADIRIGQPVTITSDAYGGKIVFHGRVEGLGAGTGSAFSLLPPQNASGNWIKIVQRLPVRIALDPRELREHPLRIGLSVKVKVDTRNQSGPQVAGSRPVARRTSSDGASAPAQIRTIIAANRGAKRP